MSPFFPLASRSRARFSHAPKFWESYGSSVGQSLLSQSEDWPLCGKLVCEPEHGGPVSCQHPVVLDLSLCRAEMPSLLASGGGGCAGEDDMVYGLCGRRGKWCLNGGELRSGGGGTGRRAVEGCWRVTSDERDGCIGSGCMYLTIQVIC